MILTHIVSCDKRGKNVTVSLIKLRTMLKRKKSGKKIYCNRFEPKIDSFGVENRVQID